MSRYSFDDETATQPALWWDPSKKGGAGRLADYLLDRKHFLVDAFSKNLTRLALNLSDDMALADKRFHDDITVLNVFFDTPIITQVKLEMKITIFDQVHFATQLQSSFGELNTVLVRSLPWAAPSACSPGCPSSASSRSPTGA